MKKTTVSLMLGLTMAGCPGGGTAGGDDGGTHDLASAPRGSGVMTLTTNSFMSAGTTIKSSSASVGFGTAAMAPSCVNQTVGACKISTCQQPPPPADGGTTNYPNAGNINITGGARMVALMPAADGSYAANVDTMNPLWNGGELLTITGAGSSVPAFSAMLNAPNAAQLSLPTAPLAPSKLMVNRSLDLAIKWTGGLGGSVQAILNASGPSGSAISLRCSFPGADTMGTIPAAALTNLPAGSGSVGVYSANEKVVPAGSYDVDVTAFALATGSNGLSASYSATYQ